MRYGRKRRSWKSREFSTATMSDNTPLSTATLPKLRGHQAAVLECVRSYAAEHGWPPTRREIAAELGISLGAATYSIDVLVYRGLIIKTDSKARGIRTI